MGLWFMSDTFYIINKKVLPNCFEKVIKIKKMVNEGAKIIDACKVVDLSRATYYKYKDYVSEYSKMPRNLVNVLVMINRVLVDEFIKNLNRDDIGIVSINRVNLNDGIAKLGIILYTYDINTFSNILDEFNLLNYEINIIDDNLH